MIERWRSFIAVTPGQAINKQVQELVRELRPACEETGQEIRWVHPSKVHITLRFLGDISVPLATSLEDACRPVAAIERFKVSYRGLGAFPDPARPRVVWLGLSDPEGRIERIHATLTSVLEEKGIPSEKRDFTPHVTLGRVKRHGKGDLSGVLERFADKEIGEEVISKVTFYRSILDSKGAVHEPKWIVHLGRERTGRD